MFELFNLHRAAGRCRGSSGRPLRSPSSAAALPQRNCCGLRWGSSFLITESEGQSEQGFNNHCLQLQNAHTVINRQKAGWIY